MPEIRVTEWATTDLLTQGDGVDAALMAMLAEAVRKAQFQVGLRRYVPDSDTIKVGVTVTIQAESGYDARLRALGLEPPTIGG